MDGFQGERIKEKLPIDHSYILYNNNPTIFYNQGFQVLKNWDKSCHNFFSGFEKQIQKNSSIQYSPYHVLLMNAYCLHEAPIVKEDTYRTFFRLSYTLREFDRLGNAHNSMFNDKWNMVSRNTQENLICPIDLR